MNEETKGLICLCWDMEKKNIERFWRRVVERVTRDYPVEWVNVPMDELAAKGVQFFGKLSTTWSEMSPSSRPPFAKTLYEWNRHKGGLKVVIAELFIQLPFSVNQKTLDALTRKFDPICDYGVHVGGYWSNGISPSDWGNVGEGWNVLRWTKPTL